MPLLTINDTFQMHAQRQYQAALRWAQAQWAQLERPSDQETGAAFWLETEYPQEEEA